ncbi:MAG: TrbI/VirB10 family protein [Pseudomonadota bacterium]
MFGKKKTPDPLDISTVAGAGTRSVNNVPLYIGGVVVACFLVIIGSVMYDRSQDPMYSSAETEKPSANSVKFANEMTADWSGKGIIAPKEEIKVVETPPPPPVAPVAEMPPLPELPAPVVDPYHNERDQLRSARIRAYQTALNSQTKVNTTVPQTTQQKIAANQQQLASLGDPTNAYQAKLAAISSNSESAAQSGSGATGTTETMTELGQTTSRTSWTMPNSVEQHAPFTLQAGFVMPAIMISGITSNLAGQVMAQVSQDIYDSPSGQHLLIPKGTRLIGTYSNDVSYGQERILMAWQRLVFPHGATLDIQTMPGADGAGNAGFSDEVNNHYLRIFGSAILLSGIIAGVTLSQDTSDDDDTDSTSSALSESLGQNLGSTMAAMVQKNMSIAPTLHIRPGYRFNVMVTKDINFNAPYRGL